MSERGREEERDLAAEGKIEGTESAEFVEFELPLERIMLGKHQPRDRESLKAWGSLTKLKENIREVGLLQPILVEEKEDGRYLLISGERRLRACKQLGHKKIRAVLPSKRTLRILEKEERTLEELALFENLRRKKLTPIEEGKAFKKLQRLLPGKTTQQVLAKRLDLDDSYISLRIKCLDLPEEVQEMLADERISVSQVRHLLRLKKIRDYNKRVEAQIQVAKKIETEKLTVSKAKKLVDSLLGAQKKRDYSHLTKLGAKKAAYFISQLDEKFGDIVLEELREEEEGEELLADLAETIPRLIEKLGELQEKLSEMG